VSDKTKTWILYNHRLMRWWGFADPHRCVLCHSAVRKLWYVPSSARVLYVTVSDRRIGRDSWLIRLRTLDYFLDWTEHETNLPDKPVTWGAHNQLKEAGFVGEADQEVHRIWVSLEYET